MNVNEERRVTFKGRSREQSVTVDDAQHIERHLVERRLSATNLRREIKRAVRDGGGVVLLKEEARAELVDALDAIDGEGRLTTDETALHDVMSEPIRTTER